MTEKKQTAVDYLLHATYKIVELNYVEQRKLNEAVEKAKAMEKEQIITAFDQGLDEIDYRFDPNKAEQYYYETFGYEDND